MAEWALSSKGAFATYSMQYRNALPPAIPVHEWFATGPSMLCHLQYWMEYFRQYDCNREFTREIWATPSGFCFSNAHRKKMKALQDS